MSDTDKKTGRLSFRIPSSFEEAINQLVTETGWTRSEIGLMGLQVFWQDVKAMALTSMPDIKPSQFEDSRALAKLFRSARASKLPIREILVRALEEKLASQDGGQTGATADNAS